LRNIGKACEQSPLTEAEVEKLFQQHDFFLELGYDGIGKDILAQRSRAQKRYDTALLGFGGRVRAIIEFKKPGRDSKLEDFAEDLYQKYVLPHSANIGVLTDGTDLLLYYRFNGDFTQQLELRLAEVSESDARKLEDFLKKRRVDLESLPSVTGWLKDNRKGPLLISDSESEEANIFFQVFQLRPESVFGHLVLALWEILPQSIEESGFTRGSYEFWLKTYARELKLKDVPRSWRSFALVDSAAVIARFSFALETAYTIISRLILAKAGDDKRFPGVRFLPRLQESFNELSTRERLKPEHHLEVIGRCFQRAGETLFHSIFSQDIFDWWFEAKRLENRALCMAVGEALLTLAQFDFLDLSGDLLGELYQHYFDRDTRKALGEFYTPSEAIEFILDECGYQGQRGERLLDPACGSGSFLVAALRRYLDKQKGRDKAEMLRDLTDGLKIVGFDINPFAVLMAQVNYAALILPLYAEVVLDNPEFRILRLPVFRTDSLRIEEKEVEKDSKKKDELTINLQFEEKTLDVSVHLPLLESKSRFVEMQVKVPRFAEARKQGLVSNLEEYVAALAIVFQAARDPRNGLAARLKARFAERADALARYLEDTLEALNSTVSLLKGKYNDGRFLKTIEDLVLAVSLKHDMQYDYVVGNPPYVRIQKIPEHVKKHWEGKYEWTEHNFDLYIPFLERTVQSADQEGWLRDGGKLGFIISDRFLNVDYGNKLREELPKALRVDLVVDFRDTRVFEDALNYPAILIGERGDGRTGEMEAARIFSSDTPFNQLLEEFHSLRKKLKGKNVLRGKAVEVFGFPRERLKADGWWLMPADEWAVFDRIRSSAGKRLIELTASASGGFAGYQTSADPIFVLDEIEDCGKLLKVHPRHEPKQCGCRKDPIEIEKGALRPFLFGKDVGRWLIDWKKSWVLFPYDVYQKKESLYEEEAVVEGWNLIPSKENIDRFDFVKPEAIETIEERFPKAWKYLRNHEAALRGREHGKYAKEKTDGSVWYGATYPRGLDYYFRPKLVLQVLSRKPSATLDLEGNFVFTAGGTAGVYGIVLEGIDHVALKCVAAVLNSRAADFQVKEISSVFGSRFYSYGDQFIERIVLPISSDGFSSLAPIVDKLLPLTNRRFDLLRKIVDFPESFVSDLTGFELDTINRLSDKQPPSEQLKVTPAEIRVEQVLYGFAVEYGSQTPFEFEAQEHAQCLAEALRNRRRRTLSKKEILGWRLPVKAAGCRKLLGLLSTAKTELGKAEKAIASREEQLNDLVYELYGIKQEERAVVEGFLNRYSSSPVATEGEDVESEGNSEMAGANA
jgi:hypothetical protein